MKNNRPLHIAETLKKIVEFSIFRFLWLGVSWLDVQVSTGLTFLSQMNLLMGLIILIPQHFTQEAPPIPSFQVNFHESE